jgi:hypothetical protein
MIVLRIKKNTREQNQDWMEHCAPHWPRIHQSFMQEFAPGLFLSWGDVPTEDNHGPGPSQTWSTGRALPTTDFDTVEEAQAFWTKNPVGDIVPECVQVTLEAL